MEINRVIETLESKIVNYFKDDKSGHDLEHLHRTLNYALYLQKHEGGDVLVIAISAFIHDLHRIISNKENRYVEPKESLPLASELIKDLPLTEKQKEHILFAIAHHEEYNFGKNKVSVSDIESKIVQDADNLDAIGAMGLLRTIKYSIAHHQVDYDPSVPLYQNEYSEANTEASLIHHINNKLIRIKDYLNTKTAREIAVSKSKLLEDFLNMYLQEYKFDAN